MSDYTNYKHSDLTSTIIKMAYYVYDYLGYGFLETVYEKALAKKLREAGFKVERQKQIKVYFEEELVGDFKADIIANNCVIIELKAIEKIHPKHEVQLVNYLKSTEIEVGLLINFGEKLEVKRKVFSNDRKRKMNRIP
ncbi:MAG: GxxExxY protein [Bacteroidota bacterium]